MTWIDLVALVPILVLAATPLSVLIAIALNRSHGLALVVTLVGLVGTVATIPVGYDVAPRRVTDLMVVDGFALFFVGLFAVVTAVVALLGWDYLQSQEIAPEEFYPLLTLATLGAAVLAATDHFTTLFLGLELLSVSLYGLIAYLRSIQRDVEAGLKYLILAAASSAFLGFGIALLYADTGALGFEAIAGSADLGTHPNLVATGLALLVVGAGFKLALVPFHIWTPDVYQGASAPVTAFIATVSKGGMLAVLLRLFDVFGEMQGNIFWIFGGIAIASMLIGNLLALLQQNLKRLLAYSSIAHLGYVLVAALALGEFGTSAATYYLVAYSVTILGAFGIVSLLSGASGEPEEIEDYRGLFWRRPVLAAILTAMLLSLAGIPLTAGFLGKLYVLLAGISSQLWGLAVALVIGSAIGLFYYLRVIVAMFSTMDATASSEVFDRKLPAVGQAILTVLVVALIVLGVYPTPLLGLMQAMFS